MIPLQDTLPAATGWQPQLRELVTSCAELCQLLQLDPAQVGASDRAARDFPLRVPRAFVALMEPGNPRDPLLLQVLAQREELASVPGFSGDPVGEQGAANPAPGIIHKYHGRVLLVLTGSCAINCRYCFRRHFPYGDNRLGQADWLAALDHIRGDPSISEVILSGGDPLMVGDRQLAERVAALAAIPHVRRLRVHTRLPVVIPERLSPALLDALCQPSLQVVMVLHCNHPREISPALGQALATARTRGVQLYNQAVLLAGVNDCVDTLCALSEALFAVGVQPYYLHLLDRVQGAAHFEVEETRARRLLDEVAARLPGYLVPNLAREQAGEGAKRRIAPL